MRTPTDATSLFPLPEKVARASPRLVGLNDTMKIFCTRLVMRVCRLRPDLYTARSQTPIAAEALAKAIDADHLQAKAEIAEAARFLNERAGQIDDGLAVIGFSLARTSRWTLGRRFRAHPLRRRLYGTGADTSRLESSLPRVTLPRTTSRAASRRHHLEESLRRAAARELLIATPGTATGSSSSTVRTPSIQGSELAWDRTLAF